jgi:uncharacterized protein
MSDTPSRTAPTAPSERIIAIDALRGFAVLGILVMNIQSFSMIGPAYLNPTAYGDLTGINRWVWILSHLFTELKFMSIFSMLFGAGVLLFTQRIEARGRRAAGLHYRRTLWLIVIGLAHAYLLWYGDILVKYGMCALLLYLFRRVRPKRLLIVGLAVLSVSSLLYFMFGLSMPYWPPESTRGLLDAWQPSAERTALIVSAYSGGWLEQMTQRVPGALMMETMVFMIQTGWRAMGLMMVGMALFKWGVLSAQRSKRFYARLAILGLGLGLPVVAYGIVRNFAVGWSMGYSFFLGSQFNYWGSIGVSLGYVAVFMLVSRSSRFTGITRRLAAVGRMALSNYLLQTIICTTIMYGHGFGLFGRVERWHQALIVIVIWIIQLAVSPVWLSHFRFGPAEWLWRTLTYWKPQPMRPAAGIPQGHL